MVNVFAVPVFFVCFRECLETSIIVSVLLAFLKRTLGPERDPKTYKTLVRQVWWGVGVGLFICIVVGCGMIGAFYGLGKVLFEGAEHAYEGAFGLIASIIITIMGAALLRVSKLQDKWRVKIAQAIEAKDTGSKLSLGGKVKRWIEKYAMFLLPFITVLREGLEAVIFIGGVGLGLPASSFPLAVLCGLLAGVIIGYLIYKGGNKAALQTFLIISTCFLYLVAAGLFSKAVGDFEMHQWVKFVGEAAAESGDGAGSYDIRQSVWHVNCCGVSSGDQSGWGVFNSLFGWTNSATYGTVISYNLYWLVVIIGFLAMRYNEVHGHWPLLKNKATRTWSGSDSSSHDEVFRSKAAQKNGHGEVGTATKELRD